jgi:hypothetical protein
LKGIYKNFLAAIHGSRKLDVVEFMLVLSCIRSAAMYRMFRMHTMRSIVSLAPVGSVALGGSSFVLKVCPGGEPRLSSTSSGWCARVVVLNFWRTLEEMCSPREQKAALHQNTSSREVGKLGIAFGGTGNSTQATEADCISTRASEYTELFKWSLRFIDSVDIYSPVRRDVIWGRYASSN